MPATLSCNGCNIITKGSSSDSSGAFKQLRRKYKRLPFTWLKRKSICSVVITIFFTIPLSLRDCKPKQGRKNKEKKIFEKISRFRYFRFHRSFRSLRHAQNYATSSSSGFLLRNLSSFLLAGERKMMSPIGREVDRGGGTMTGPRQGQQRSRADCSELLHKRVSKCDESS